MGSLDEFFSRNETEREKSNPRRKAAGAAAVRVVFTLHRLFPPNDITRTPSVHPDFRLRVTYFANMSFDEVFVTSPWNVLSRSSVIPPSPSKLHPYCCRSEYGIASKHTAQHRAISSAQVALGITKTRVAPNHGPLLSAPFTFCCIVLCTSAVSRPRSGALVVHTPSILQYTSRILRVLLPPSVPRSMKP